MPRKKTLPVAEGEEPWTAAEIAEVRAELESDVARLETAVKKAREELDLMFDDERGGKDDADIGITNFERDQEMSLARNTQAILEQAQLALRKFESGDYGWCESCGKPIGKDRLQIFPRATLCVECKRKLERR